MYMLVKYLAVICVLLLAATASAQDTVVTGPGQVTELWEGKALTAKFRVGICRKPDGSARGVLILRHRSGNEDVYHLYGIMKDGSFLLTHSSGHRISGKITGPDSMEGNARLSSGIRLSLSGKRIQNARLAAGDCAPLPQ